MLRDYESMWGELRSQLKERVRMENISEKEEDPESYYLYVVIKMMDNMEYFDWFGTHCEGGTKGEEQREIQRRHH